MALLLADGNLIDGTGAPPVTGCSVLLDGDEIVARGADVAEAVLRFDDVETIDCGGLTVMPGLIDSHTHIAFGEVQSNDELFGPHRDEAFTSILAAWNATKFVRAGVTSIFDVDTLWNTSLALRDAIEAGIVEGPRMACGGQALMTSVGGTAGRFIPDAGPAGYAHVVRDNADIVRVVRAQAKNGVDWVKLHVTGLIPSQRVGEIQVWTFEELKVACDTAHSLGLPVAAHCRNASSTRDAARAGVDLIFHASFLDDEALEAVVESGAAIGPTFTFLANLVAYGDRVGASPELVELFRGEIEQTAQMLRQAYDAGVKLLCGSECGFAVTPYGEWHARELEIFCDQLDLTPLEAITCATANGAIAMKKKGEIGTVEVGRLADVIVVDGDPATDVRILGDRTRLREVISRGARVDLTRPWPERRFRPGEKVGEFASQTLTRELTQELSPDIVANA
jgi:imidazolonepropionase-like amidohydrolase